MEKGIKDDQDEMREKKWEEEAGRGWEFNLRRSIREKRTGSEQQKTKTPVRQT
jgi:hypothetical protein